MQGPAAALQQDHGGPWVLPWLRLGSGPSPGLLAARIAATGSGRGQDQGGPLHHGEDRHHHRQRGARAGGADREQLPPSSGATVGPAASRPWPGPWVLRLAPAMPWALSGASGREDRRHGEDHHRRQ